MKIKLAENTKPELLEDFLNVAHLIVSLNKHDYENVEINNSFAVYGTFDISYERAKLQNEINKEITNEQWEELCKYFSSKKVIKDIKEYENLFEDDIFEWVYEYVQRPKNDTLSEFYCEVTYTNDSLTTEIDVEIEGSIEEPEVGEPQDYSWISQYNRGIN